MCRRRVSTRESHPAHASHRRQPSRSQRTSATSQTPRPVRAGRKQSDLEVIRLPLSLRLIAFLAGAIFFFLLLALQERDAFFHPLRRGSTLQVMIEELL